MRKEDDKQKKSYSGAVDDSFPHILEYERRKKVVIPLLL